MTGRYVPPLLPGLYPPPKRGLLRRLLGVVVRFARAWWAATKDDEMLRDDAWRNSAP